MTTPHPETVFVLQTKNQAYVDGTDKRPASLTGSAGGCYGAVQVLLIIGLGMLVWAYNSYQDYLTLRDEGQIIEGDMTGHRYTTDDEGAETYYLTYKFEIREGSLKGTYEREQIVNHDQYERYEFGGSVDILYDPDDPELSKIADTNKPPYSQASVCAGFLLGYLVMLTWMIRDDLRKRRLANQGRLIYGEIRESSSEPDADGDYKVKLHYQFVSPTTGQEIEKTASQLRTDLKDAALPSAGTQVAILYLSDTHYTIL
jgi:hypothetical protein